MKSEVERKCKHEMVEELRRALQEAKVEESLTYVVATMRALKSRTEENDSHLGPTLNVEVNFEGTPVQALLDTGSPVTIVSLSSLLCALVRQRPEKQNGRKE